MTGNAATVNGRSPPPSAKHVPTPPSLSSAAPPPPPDTVTTSTTNTRGRHVQPPPAPSNDVDVWHDEQFLLRFFRYFSATELCVLAQVRFNDEATHATHATHATYATVPPNFCPHLCQISTDFENCQNACYLLLGFPRLLESPGFFCQQKSGNLVLLLVFLTFIAYFTR